MTASTRIRRAVPGDAPAIAALHVAVWRETYRKLLPAEVLARLSVTRRTERWRELLGGPDRAWPGFAAFVAIGPGDVVPAVVGFGCCGAQRTPALAREGYGGQVLALYVRWANQRQGIGRRLMASMASSLGERGIQGMSVRTLEGNRLGRRFCEALDGTLLGRHEGECGDATLVEAAYGWPELARLVAYAGAPGSGATQA